MIIAPKTIATTSFNDQKPGTSGLRKPTNVFLEKKNYTENFIQSIINCILETEGNLNGKVLVVGGDGRYYLREAVDIIIQIAVANGLKRLQVGKGGILSTPALSNLIRKNNENGLYTVGGIILTASHNPGGKDGDFGIKFNARNGGPAPDGVTNRIYEISQNLKEYKSLVDQKLTVDLDKVGEYRFNVDGIGEVLIEVIDPVEKYSELMKSIYNFDQIKELLQSFPIVVNSMSGVTGPYVESIFNQDLSLSSNPKSRLINTQPLPDFGGHHPDPNLTYAADLVDIMKGDSTYQFGAAYDGDGDRNMIIGQNGFFVTPSDSLAVIAANIDCIDYFRKTGVKGFARSMPTSGAVDRVGADKGVKVYEVPTGWKYFGNLMDAGMLSLCGEESFGTGSDHIREKDGVWASLAILQILAAKKISLKELLEAHWKKYGRNYFMRLDYEGLDSEKAAEMMKKCQEKVLEWNENKFVEEIIKPVFKEGNLPKLAKRDNFEYIDPVDSSKAVGQGLRVIFEDTSRIVLRLSGTGSSGATLRVYLERYDSNDLFGDPKSKLGDLMKIALSITNLKETFGIDEPTVIT